MTLAGRAQRPEGAEADAALAAFELAHPFARHYSTFGDFSCWVLRVERVRWVGGIDLWVTTPPGWRTRPRRLRRTVHRPRWPPAGDSRTRPPLA